jgi:transposase
MANVLKHEKQIEICALGRLGWSLRRIEEATGVRRETIGRYLKAAGVEVRSPRGRRLAAPDSKAASQATADPGPDSKAASRVTTDSSTETARPGETSGLERGPARRTVQVSTCEPHREQIVAALENGRNVMSIWQDLVDDHGFSNSYESVKRFVRKHRGATSREAHPTIQTDPGEEGQVDTDAARRSPRRSAHETRASPCRARTRAEVTRRNRPGSTNTAA